MEEPDIAIVSGDALASPQKLVQSIGQMSGADSKAVAAFMLRVELNEARQRHERVPNQPRSG